MDKDNDGLVSYNEFIAETKDNDFDKDEEWKPLTEEEQFSDEEYKEYERLLAEEVILENNSFAGQSLLHKEVWVESLL